MLLVIDIGNTNIVVGIFDGHHLKHSWRVSTRRDQTVDEYFILLKNLLERDAIRRKEVLAAVISSVVPPLNDCFETLCNQYFEIEPLFIEPETQSLIPVRYHHPSDVGADRIVNAVAARDMFGIPAIVVDFGTATTFDAVSKAGEYVGGIIAPGIGISAEALFNKAARLPRIDIRKPIHTIGQTTVESMQSGIFYGYVGLIEGILERMKKELGPARVIATGGLARLISVEYPGFDFIEDDLTLHGLRIFYDNSES
jgi:type III pantothenate kinase